jgi:transposase InsO family protein
MGRTEFSMDPDIVAAVAQVVAGESLNVARFCRTHRLSRSVFYKYVTRFRVEGAAGFTRRSTAPHHRPSTVSGVVREAVVRARKELDDEGLDNGAVSILWRLQDTGGLAVPSRATIHRILVDRGQVVPEPRKKPRTRRRFEYADPNGLWQIDGMEFRLAGGETVCVLQILDDHSRLDVGSYAARSENGADTWAALQQAFAGHGLPVRVLSDNGLAFSGKHRGVMVEVERRLAEHGIVTIASSVHHPQTCGKNERVHQTLQKWLSKQTVPDTLVALQALLDRYRVIYNNRRHQSLDGQTPQQRHDATPRATPDGSYRGAAGTTTRKVSTTGVVRFSGCAIIIGRRWAHSSATLHWQGNRVSIMIDTTVARTLTLDRTKRYQPLN